MASPLEEAADFLREARPHQGLTSVRACTTIGKARRGLLRGVVHIRTASAEIGSPELMAEFERLREQVNSVRGQLASLSTRVRRLVKKHRGVSRG